MTETTSDKVLGVLDLFLGDQAEWTVEEAAAALGQSVTTTYRYFKSLLRSGLLNAYVPGRYVLGPGIVQLDRQIRLHDPLLNAAQPEMERLAVNVGGAVAVLLARFYHDGVMCVHQIHGDRPLRSVSYERGRVMPIDRGASSKVILANLSPRALRRLQESGGDGAPPMQLSPSQKADLKAIRTRGVCITEAELDDGVRGIAVPIFQPDRTIIGSLSLVVPLDRPGVAEMVEQLVLTRGAIEAAVAIRASRPHDGEDYA